MNLLPGDGRYHTFYCVGVPEIDIVNITRASTSVPYVTNDDLHTHKRYQEKLEEDRSKKTHQNRCRVCYRHGECILFRFCEECRECVCSGGSGEDKS